MCSGIIKHFLYLPRNKKNMNKDRFAIGVLIITMFSCVGGNDLEITPIEGIPPQINGCSCMFSRTRSDFENNKFVFFTTGKVSVLSVNEEVHTWAPFSVEESPYNVITTYSSEERIGAGKKAFEGTIIITSKEGESTSFSIYGQCGC